MKNYEWLKKIEAIIYQLKEGCSSADELIARCEQYTEEEEKLDANGNKVVVVTRPIHISHPMEFKRRYWHPEEGKAIDIFTDPRFD